MGTTPKLILLLLYPWIAHGPSMMAATLPSENKPRRTCGLRISTGLDGFAVLSRFIAASPFWANSELIPRSLTFVPS